MRSTAGVQTLELPDIEGHAAGIMQNGWPRGQADTESSGQVVALDLGLGIFERPGNVVNAGACGLAVAVDGEEAVAFGEEELERAGTRVGKFVRGAEAAVTGLEDDGLAGKAAAAVEGELALGALLMPHLRPMTGQAIEQTRGGCAEEIVCVDREEIDAGHAVSRVADIGTEIDLRKVARTRDGRQTAKLDAIHPEGNDAEPGRALEGVELEAVRKERGEGCGW